MFNFQEWLSSKKTKDMIVTQIMLLVAAYLNLGPEAMALIAGVGGVKIAGQAAVDAKKANKN